MKFGDYCSDLYLVLQENSTAHTAKLGAICRRILLDIADDYLGFCQANGLERQRLVFTDLVRSAKQNAKYIGSYSYEDAIALSYDTSGEIELVEVGQSFRASLAAISYFIASNERYRFTLSNLLDQMARENVELALGRLALLTLSDHENVPIQLSIERKLEKYLFFVRDELSEDQFLRD